MAKKPLIIVESPAKIKTLKKFLGDKFMIESSVGHIRDLPSKGLGIDLANNFEPTYEPMKDKEAVISNLVRSAKYADIVYLAPDPDREGEAIAWHIASLLPKGTNFKRVTFNAITKDAVKEALAHPRDIDYALVNAQQARRLLDRLVGYSISPILMRRVQGSRDGLSAGRVQSVALKLVVDREKAIEAFIPKEYWNIKAELEGHGKVFSAYLYSVDGQKVEKDIEDGKFYIKNAQEAQAIVDRLKGSSYAVEHVEQREKRRFPVAPFITSTLQQEASRHYGYSASRTMSIAQRLYEGIDVGQDGPEGLITYMRTDSVRIEPQAITAAREFIKNTYGNQYLPQSAVNYSTKQNAQDAHEAIRPTNTDYTPEKIKQFLSEEEFKLYLLIWRRYIASQMNPAIYDTLTCDIEASKNLMLRATGSVIKFDGFLAAYEEKTDEAKEEENRLPPLQAGDKLKLEKPVSDQVFTRPPPRFTEASLVKELEKLGIGRPSTYASIMNKIQSRDYTTKEKSTLKPTELGRVIAKMLEDNFGVIMDVHFTANMEDALEHVASDTYGWRTLLHDFWIEFEPMVTKAEESAHVPKELTDKICPECGAKLQKVWSKNKYFYGCSKYPDCSFTASMEGLNFKKEDYNPNFDWDQPCPKCEAPTVIRQGKFGVFLGCSKYPDCNGIINVPRKEDEILGDIPGCPAIGCDGKMVQRRSRFGKTFFSCSNYPDCDVIVNDLSMLSDKYHMHQKTAYVKKSKFGKAKGDKTEKPAKKAAKKTVKKTTSSAKKTTKAKVTKAQKEYIVAKELADVINKTSCSRTEATKLIWDYIKSHNLQDPSDKRQINPDAQLAAALGEKKPFNMMKLAGLLSKKLS